MANRISPPLRLSASCSQRPEAHAILYAILHSAGFAAVTVLMTWGLFALFFLILGGFSFDGFMHQLGNLTSRYSAASAERIAAFKHIVVAAHVILVAGLVILRRHRIVSPRPNRGDFDHG